MTAGISLRGCLAVIGLCTLFLGIVVISVHTDTAVQAEVPCKVNKDEMCLQRKECAFQCKVCSVNDDKCCCLHTDKCTCIDPTRPGLTCCD